MYIAFIIIFNAISINRFSRVLIYFDDKKLFVFVHALNFVIIIVLSVLFKMLNKTINLYVFDFK